MSKKATRAIANWRSITYVTAEKSKFTHMKSPLTRSLRKQTPMSKKATRAIANRRSIPYVTAEKLKFTHMKEQSKEIFNYCCNTFLLITPLSVIILTI